MQEFLKKCINMIGDAKNHSRISGLIRIFSINNCFLIEAVTNEFDG
jgi:hypothetical protein